MKMLVSGEIHLRGKKGPLGAVAKVANQVCVCVCAFCVCLPDKCNYILKGNVYIDHKPICDDGWDQGEATVACR